MTLWHIGDFDKHLEQVPRPLPWEIVGVLPTRDEYEALGDAVFNAATAFCYSVSDGPTEVWCPMRSVEGRFCPPELIAAVLNVLLVAFNGDHLYAEDSVIVPFEYVSGPLVDGDNKPVVRDAVFWIGAPTEDPDKERYHCYRSVHSSVLPILWSSPEGWDE